MQEKEQPGRLRDLIKTVRECKTAAEERAVIAKESAEIRESFADKTYKFRHRSVAKLLFIQMMGYATNFGQVECVKLIASNHYTEKRVGYLGLTQLLNEKDDVLLLVENHMQIDMNSANNQVLGVALASFANIATAEMCRDLCKDVMRLMRHSNSYIRKKAVLAGTRIVWKCPDIVEDLILEVPRLLEDKSHVVVLCAVSYLLEILKVEGVDAHRFEGHLSLLVRALRNLIHTIHSPEHTIGGIIDPFLQVNLIRLIGKLCVAEVAEEVIDCLAQIATNTDPSKNPGNAVLYECVRTIMDIRSTSGLRVLATNIMGRFLLNRDNNLRYVALNSLLKLVSVDVVAVQRHKVTILDCLKDPDMAIRRKALELTEALINEANVRQIVEELVNHLLEAEDEFKEALVTKLCYALEKHSPDTRWHFDNFYMILTMAGAFVTEEVVASTTQIFQASSELARYATYKLLEGLPEHSSQQAYALLAVWCMGEFADLISVPSADLPGVSAQKLVSDLESLLGPLCDLAVKEYVLTALIKISARLPASIPQIRTILSTVSDDINSEVQQRACEYLQLLEPTWNELRAPLLEKIPLMQRTPDSGALESVKTDSQPAEQTTQQLASGNLLDLDLLLDPEPAVVAQPSEAAALVQIFGDGGGFQEFIGAAPAAHRFVGFEDAEVRVDFCCVPAGMNETQIDMTVTNLTLERIEGFRLSVAVLKHLTMNLLGASDSMMESGGVITQRLMVTNTLKGQKPIALRLKIEYAMQQMERSKLATIDQFPADF